MEELTIKIGCVLFILIIVYNFVKFLKAVYESKN